MKYKMKRSLATGSCLTLALAGWAPVLAQSPEGRAEKKADKNPTTEHSQATPEVKQKPDENRFTAIGYVHDLEGLAVQNNDFRRVIYTAEHCQLVLMALKPREEIGAEIHRLDQFFRIEAGSGEVVLDGVRTAIRAGFAVVVPAGVRHNIINTGSIPLKLYTIYSPPNHRDGVIHHTRADAVADNEHFDGRTTK